MGSLPPAWVTSVLSVARFDRYRVVTSGESDAAIALYAWNVEVSAAFVVPLHWAEMAFRNVLHARLAGHYGRADWWVAAPLDQNGHRKVGEAQAMLRRLGKNPTIADSVVAELSLGFWVSLLAKHYSRTLWVPLLWRCFPGRSRLDVHTDYKHVLFLRNRISHGEPIHRRHLAADHAAVCRLLGELSPQALHLARPHDQVPAVLARRPTP
ncbi:MAG: hypothetical protein L0H84_05865 [Pseudonocardia sp.]|nr:hypothetical protein [Pseudonocardia sp.]